MKKILIVFFAAFSLFGFTSNANAILLAPGTGPTVTGAGVTPSNYGTEVDSMLQLYSFGTPGSLITGSITAKVYQNSLGMLFAYDILRNADGTDDFVSRMTATSFAGFTVDANYDPLTTGNSIGFEVDRISASVVGFNFNPRLGAGGGDTKTLYVQTDASWYQPGTIALINGQSENFDGFAPANAVPEPASLSLLGLGIAGLLRSKRRKNKSDLQLDL